MKKILGLFLAGVSMTSNTQAATLVSSADGALDQQIQQILAQEHIINAQFLVIKDNQVRWSQAYGYVDLAQQKPTTTDTKVRIASISKIFTAAALLQLNEQKQNKILNQPLENILKFPVVNPNYPQQAILTKYLLDHTSSINDDFYNNSWTNAVELAKIPLAHFFESKDSYFNFAPNGETFRYSNLGYGTIGSIVEVLSGQKFADYTEKNLFRPLNMDASYMPAHLKNWSQISPLYRWDAQTESYTLTLDDYTKTPPKDLPRSLPLGNALINSPTGGVRTSINDLSHAILMLLNYGKYQNQQILSPAIVNSMLQMHWYGGNPSDTYAYQQDGYALQPTDLMVNGARVWGHIGDAYGLISAAYLQPDQKFAIIMFLNGTNYSDESGFFPIEPKLANLLSQHFDLVDKHYKLKIAINKAHLTVNSRKIIFEHPALGKDSVLLIHAIDALQLSAKKTSSGVTIYNPNTHLEFKFGATTASLNGKQIKLAPNFVQLVAGQIYINLPQLANYFRLNYELSSGS